MKIYGREEAIKMLLDGKQMTSDEFNYPDDTYCVYDKTIKNELPFRFIYKDLNSAMHGAWSFETWRERKYQPKDKELVWSWNPEDEALAALRYYDAKNDATFNFRGARNGRACENYAPFDGTPPPNLCSVDELED